MKKNLLKRIGAVALALAVSMTMGTAAFAADASTAKGVADVAESNETTLTIPKTIYVYNDESTNVYQPDITYTYTVGTVETTSADTVTDVSGNKATVKSGISGGVTLTTDKAEFKNTDTVTASTSGAAITKNIVVSVDLSQFSSAGVYRYSITEDVPDALTTAGITRDQKYSSVRYLDVYIGNDANGTNGKKVIGYVLFVDNDGKGVIDGKTSGNSTITGKSNGFEQAIYTGDNYTEQSDKTAYADRYYTYNYTIEKKIEGTLADKNNAFPFTFATSGVTGQKYLVSTTGTSLAGAPDGVAAVGTDVTANLADGKTITIKGLPANTKFNVTEKNNTADTYTLGVVDESQTDPVVDNASVAPSNNKAMFNELTAMTNYAAYNNPKGTEPTASYSAATFTNTLNEVSPTNVVMRFAPYLFILGAAIVLLVLMRRRKASQDAE